MKIAFYAPLKSPEHPVPSGDRAMARAICAALDAGGFDVHVASNLRLYDGRGDRDVQTDLEQAAEVEVARILKDPASRDWRGWLTYHNYYKAPDIIGPAVCRALDIPYFQAESTRARKRLNGPWARFAALAEHACDQARAVFYLTARDAEALRRDAPASQTLVHLPPFLGQSHLPAASSLDGPMLSVGMFRRGDKLASYQLIADTLPLLSAPDWTLDIVGDGAARADVERLMQPFGARVRLHGMLSADALSGLYSRAALLFWPGVNEAFGLTYLEAQAAGVPVVAQDRPGVRDVVTGAHPAPRDGPAAMAHALDRLLRDQAHRAACAGHARGYVQDHHLLAAAARTLRTAITAAAGAAP